MSRRKAAHAAHPDAARDLVSNFPDEIWPGVGQVVAGYWAANSEIDAIRLIETFHCEQARIVLPRVAGQDVPLDFHAWHPEDDLERSAHGISAPKESATRLTPQLLLVPLLAFDDRGYRLGYGGGYYDRTLQRLRKERPLVAVGYAFAAQEVDALPVSPLDQRLDWIITEREAIRS